MIDWPYITSKLRAKHGSLVKTARKVSMSPDALRQLNRGEVQEPRYSVGVRLMEEHRKIEGHQFSGLIANIRNNSEEN